jgi:voltage-gated potassium channel
MVLGLSLVLRLIQTLFRPGKVYFECPSCGLSRHDPDAVHCKHCGTLIKIGTAGD